MESIAVHEHILSDQDNPGDIIESTVLPIEVNDESEPSSLQVPVKVGEAALSAITWAISDREGNRIEMTTTESE